MKYLKLFEKQIKSADTIDNSKKYWLLPIDYRFKDSLIKIGCGQDRISTFLANHFIREENIYKYTFASSDFGWMPYIDKLTDDYFEENGYKFSGFVNMEKYDKDFIKNILLNLSLNKYNL